MNSQIYKWGFFLLLVINVLLTALLFSGRPSPPKAVDMRVQISDRLQLDQAQQSQFIELAGIHRAQVKMLDKQQQALIIEYFINESQAVAVRQTLLEKIKALYAEKVTVTYNHFAEIEALCTKEQLPAFRAMLKELIPLISGSHPGGPPPNRHRPPGR